MTVEIRPRHAFTNLLFGDRWVTWNGTIYHARTVDPAKFPEVIAHESVHARRQQEQGWWGWIFRYCFSRPFRLREEALAIVVELQARPEEHREFYRDAYADELSGISYFWCASSREAALRAIHEAATA